MSDYKIALVTGASAGFGLEIAKVLASNGFKVIAAARRLDKLEALKDLYPSLILPLELDVTDNAAVEKALDSLPFEFKDIDVLINNAGLALGVDRAQNCDLNEWNVMVDTNIKGLLNVTYKVLPSMIKRNFGYVINLGSTAGAWPYTGSNVYGATKAFVEQFSRNLRCDTQGTAVKVTVIKPGLCSDTEFSNVRLHGDLDKVKAVYQDTKAITPKDIADTVWYLVNTSAHVNVNEMELMPVCQTYGGLSVTRKRDFNKK